MSEQQAVREPKEREVKNEDYLKVQCAKRKWDCWKLTVPAKRGVPDRMIIASKGVIALTEVKKPGGVISALQGRVIADLNRRGVNAFIVENKEDIDGVMALLDSKVRDAV